jgi:hypothetical protein
MTLIDWELYSKITAAELLSLGWLTKGVNIYLFVCYFMIYFIVCKRTRKTKSSCFRADEQICCG